LTDTAGKPFTDAALKSKMALVFFGFTHCPDICPVTMATLSGVMKTLGEDAGQVIPVFITVDPERDTPKVMKEYVDNFDSRIVGLSGTREQVEKAAAAYKVYHAKVEPAAAEKKEDEHHA